MSSSSFDHAPARIAGDSHAHSEMAVMTLPVVLAMILVATLTVGVRDAEAAKRALLIGVDSYKNLPYDSPVGRRMVNLKGAVNDVNAYADALVARFEFRRDEIKTLTNAAATRENVLAAFRDWLIRGTRDGDVVVFIFTGHGTQVPDENADEDDGLDEALAPYDLVPGARTVRDARLILDDEIGELIGQLTGRSLVFIVDACHSGTSTRGIGESALNGTESTSDRGAARFISLDGLPVVTANNRSVTSSSPTWERVGDQVVMTSSGPTQTSIEVRTGSGMFHGAFSAALVEAMNRLPHPSYRDLYVYARAVMRDKFKVPQDPVMETGQPRSLDLPAFGR